MAVVRGLTLEELRGDVGRNLMGSRFWKGVTTSAGDSSSLIDTALRGGDDEHNGKYFRLTGGAVDGETGRASDYDSGTTDVTLNPVLSGVTGSGSTYEMWEEDYNPDDIDDWLNEAVDNLTRRYYDPEVDESLHLSSFDSKYAIPSQFAALTQLEYRVLRRQTVIDSCDTVWPTIDADVTASVDNQIKRRGHASLKLVIASGAAITDDLATKTFAARDLSRYDKIGFWIRSSRLLTAGQQSIILSDAAGIEETLAIPALSATNTWEYHEVSFANPEDNTAITTITLDYTTDTGGETVWLDDITAFDSLTEEWVRIPEELWRVDRLNRNIEFSEGTPAYGKLRIWGGDNPALFSSDASVSEVPESYLIAYATLHALLSAPDTSLAYRTKLGHWSSREARLLRQVSVRENWHEVT